MFSPKNCGWRVPHILSVTWQQYKIQRFVGFLHKIAFVLSHKRPKMSHRRELHPSTRSNLSLSIPPPLLLNNAFEEQFCIAVYLWCMYLGAFHRSPHTHPGITHALSWHYLSGRILPTHPSMKPNYMFSELFWILKLERIGIWGLDTCKYLYNRITRLTRWVS